MSTIVIPPAKQNPPQDYYEIGRLFEEFIKNLFNEKSFTLTKWREARKYHNNSIPGDHGYPDLEIMFGKSTKYKFAIECKWRSSFGTGEITWAKDYEIERYKEFARNTRMPVFVAIGIGGTSDNPEKLFVTPLYDIIDKTKIKESDLLVYKRKANRRFFYDTVQKELF